MKLREAFLQQAIACRELGSPFMYALLNLLAERWDTQTDLGRLCATWRGDIGPSGASLPLRIAGGLHHLVLTGQDPALKAAYPPATVSEATLARAVQNALDHHQGYFLTWMQSAPQTNEVRRSAAFIAAAHWLAGGLNLPFILSELGASAGLNTQWDRYALETPQGRLGPPDPVLVLRPDWTGPAPLPRSVDVTDRGGVDLNPLDVRDQGAARRLCAYLWPDQPDRLHLTRAAIAAVSAPPDRGDAIDWLRARLQSASQANHIHMVFHSIAWQYFPPETQSAGTALIEEAGARATPDGPLAWLAMEADDGSQGGAALDLRLWPGDRHFCLGRVDFHGRWVRWTAPPRFP